MEADDRGRKDDERPDGLSVVIPAYNEEAGLPAVLSDLLATLRESGPAAWEVIVVDDGSSDGTAAAARREAVTVLRHDRNRGYGASLKTGIRRARHPLIAITDADGTYPNGDIPRLLRQLREEGLDMVIGARTGDDVRIPPLRRPAKRMLRALATYVSATPIPDLNSGLRVFRREACMRFFDLLPDGFSFTTTISLAMLQSGFRVGYASIDYHARLGASKIRPVRDLLNFIQLVLRIGLYFAPLKIFVPMGWMLMGVGVAWGIVSRIAFGRLADVSTLVVMMTGIQVFVIGLVAELINRRVPNAYRQEG